MSELQYTEDRELLSKKIYDYCIKVEWEPNKLEEFAKELGLTITIIKKLAKEYAKKNLDEEAFKQLSQKISDTNKRKTINNVPKLYIINPILLELREKETYYLWENAEEKEVVLEYIFNYCGGLNWQHDKYKELVERIGFDKAHIKLLIKKYVESYLSTEEYNLLMENMDEKSF